MSNSKKAESFNGMDRDFFDFDSKASTFQTPPSTLTFFHVAVKASLSLAPVLMRNSRIRQTMRFLSVRSTSTRRSSCSASR